MALGAQIIDEDTGGVPTTVLLDPNIIFEDDARNGTLEMWFTTLTGGTFPKIGDDSLTDEDFTFNSGERAEIVHRPDLYKTTDRNMKHEFVVSAPSLLSSTSRLYATASFVDTSTDQYYIEWEGTTTTVNLYKALPGSTSLGSILETKAMGFILANIKEYKITIELTATTIIFSAEDLDTAATTSVTFTSGAAGSLGGGTFGFRWHRDPPGAAVDYFFAKSIVTYTTAGVPIDSGTLQTINSERSTDPSSPDLILDEEFDTLLRWSEFKVFGFLGIKPVLVSGEVEFEGVDQVSEENIGAMDLLPTTEFSYDTKDVTIIAEFRAPDDSFAPFFFFRMTERDRPGAFPSLGGTNNNSDGYVLFCPTATLTGEIRRISGGVIGGAAVGVGTVPVISVTDKVYFIKVKMNAGSIKVFSWETGEDESVEPDITFTDGSPFLSGTIGFSSHLDPSASSTKWFLRSVQMFGQIEAGVVDSGQGYLYDFGDGTDSGRTNDEIVNHVFGMDATLATELITTTVSIVSVNDVPETSAIITWLVTNADPTAILTAPSTAITGSQITLNAAGSFDPEGGSLLYTFDPGDGTPAVTQASALFVYTYTTANNSTLLAPNNTGFTATLFVTDLASNVSVTVSTVIQVFDGTGLFITVEPQKGFTDIKEVRTTSGLTIAEAPERKGSILQHMKGGARTFALTGYHFGDIDADDATMKAEAEAEARLFEDLEGEGTLVQIDLARYGIIQGIIEGYSSGVNEEDDFTINFTFRLVEIDPAQLEF